VSFLERVVVLLLVVSACASPVTPPLPGISGSPSAAGTQPTSAAPVSPGSKGPTALPTHGTSPAGTSGPTGSGSPNSGFQDPLEAAAPTTPAPEPTTAEDLIATALAGGQIDWPTALRDRIWANWGDSRMPSELLGAGPGTQDDVGIGIDPYLFSSDIPDDVYAQIEPYLVRPTDPTSAFYPGAVAAITSSGSAGAMAAAPPGSDGLTAMDDCGESAPWASQNGLHPFKVWAPCTGDYAADIAAAVAALNDIWAPETSLMGPPLPDDGTGGDSSIDVYLVDSTAQCVPDRTPCARLPPDAAGVAMGALVAPDHQKPLATSAFLILPRSLIADPGHLKLELIHELFHALEYAHNIDGLETESATYWQVEADAKWAQAWLGSQPGQGISGLIRSSIYIPYFVNKFQLRDIPLNEPNTEAGHAGYRAFIWPFFAQQETGGPQVVGQIWQALEGVRSFADADAATDRVFSFSDHFADFAFRNLNMDLEPGDPIQPRYKALDGTFTDGYGPGAARKKGEVTVSVSPPGQTNDIDEQLAPLTSHYRTVSIDPSVHQLVLDFSHLQGGDVKPDVVVELTSADGTTSWQRRTLSPASTTWCLDDPENRISAFLLILSNASYAADQTVNGTFGLTGRDTCAQGHGTITWTYHHYQTPVGPMEDDITVVVDVEVKETFPDFFVDDGSSWTLSGTGADDCNAITYSGNGPFAGTLAFSIDPDTHVAQLHAQVAGTAHFVPATDCGSARDEPYGAALWCHAPLVGLELVGTASADGTSVSFDCQDSRTLEAPPINDVKDVTASGTLHIKPTSP
jgi:hypothetical protein